MNTSGLLPPQDAAGPSDMPGTYPSDLLKPLLPLPATQSPVHSGSVPAGSDTTVATAPGPSSGSEPTTSKRSRKKRKSTGLASLETSTSRPIEAARVLSSRVGSWGRPEGERMGSNGSFVSSSATLAAHTSAPATPPSMSRSTSAEASTPTRNAPGIRITPATPPKLKSMAKPNPPPLMPAVSTRSFHRTSTSPATMTSASSVTSRTPSPVANQYPLRSPSIDSDVAWTSFTEESAVSATYTPTGGEIPFPLASAVIAPSPMRATDGSMHEIDPHDTAGSRTQSAASCEKMHENASNTVPSPSPSPAPTTQPSQNTPNFNIRPWSSSSQEEGTGWPSLAEKFSEHDGKKVRDWHDELDTLLVFAGLFSAIVTAFIIEFYSALLPDRDDRRERQMTRLSEQMEQLTVYLVLQDPTKVKILPPVHFPEFTPPDSAVWTNSLWFSSLLCALMAAALGTLVKQWLRRYVAVDYSASRERVRLREYRHSGLVLWIVPQIIAFLPVLLRIALNLFFAGLLVQLWQFDTIVTKLCACWVALWTAVYMLATALPAFFPGCPYASPEALAWAYLMHFARHGTEGWRSFSWDEREGVCKQNADLDIPALATAALTFSDNFLEESIRECAQHLHPWEVPLFIGECFRLRLHLPQKVRLTRNGKFDPKWQFSKFSRQASLAFVDIALDAGEKILSTATGSSGARILTVIICIRDILRSNSWDLPVSTQDRLRQFFVKNLETLQKTKSQLSFEFVDTIASVLYSRPGLVGTDLASALPQLMNIMREAPKTRLSEISSLEACVAILSLLPLSEVDEKEVDKFLNIQVKAVQIAASDPRSLSTYTSESQRAALLLQRCLQETARMAPSSNQRALRNAFMTLRETVFPPPKAPSKSNRRSFIR